MSEFEIKSFRSQPTKVRVGDSDKDGKQLELTIRDISYGKHTEFKQILSNVWMKVQTAPKTAKYFDEIIKKQVESGMSISESINSIICSVSEIYKTLNEDDKTHLLSILTDDQINKENINDLQACEVYGLLTWLIERNLQAEKNFEASLSSILNLDSRNDAK